MGNTGQRKCSQKIKRVENILQGSNESLKLWVILALISRFSRYWSQHKIFSSCRG
jgi:hypothetical protein